jgi:hypothetical protein
MIYLYIYLIGYIACYYSLRHYFSYDGGGWNWNDVIYCLLLAITSWCGVGVYGVMYVVDYKLYRYIKKINGKPPEWL